MRASLASRPLGRTAATAKAVPVAPPSTKPSICHHHGLFHRLECSRMKAPVPQRLNKIPSPTKRKVFALPRPQKRNKLARPRRLKGFALLLSRKRNKLTQRRRMKRFALLLSRKLNKLALRTRRK